MNPSYPCYQPDYQASANIQKAHNGYLVNTCNGQFIAKSLKSAIALLAEHFEPKRRS